MFKGWTWLVTAFSLLGASEAIAQTSFSSFNELRGNELVPHYSGRFYSEDGRQFRLRVYGCEFDVVDDESGQSLAKQILRGVRAEFRKNPKVYSDWGSATIERVMLLANPRRVDYSVRMPSGFECDGRTSLSFVNVARYDFHDSNLDAKFGQRRIALIIIQSDYRNGEPEGKWKRFILIMRPDLFTPKQESEAWQIGGEIGVALFKALVAPRRR